MNRQTRRSQQPIPQPSAGNEKRARLIVMAIITVIIVAVAVFAFVRLANPSNDQPTPPPANTGGVTDSIDPESGDVFVRDDSHRLNDLAEPQAIFVEFLDFECDTCSIAFPDVEKINQNYGDQVLVVIRYFPSPTHSNSMTSARAVEAAAKQGQFLEMATLVFEKQAAWINKNSPMDTLFRSYAESLGLDMERWDADYNDPATAERIQRDYSDGLSLGVHGTPTFFLNGFQIQPNNYDEMAAMVENTIGG